MCVIQDVVFNWIGPHEMVEKFMSQHRRSRPHPDLLIGTLNVAMNANGVSVMENNIALPAQYQMPIQ